MISVKSMIIYQICMIQEAQYIMMYHNIVLFGIIVYLYSYYQYHYNNKKKLSLYAHVLVHILANAGLIILYSGDITTIF